MNQQVEISLKQIYEDIYQVSFPNGDFYKGRVEFEYNQENENPNFNTPILHGFGEMFYHNGEIYQGEFKKNKKDGYGFLKTCIGNFEGSFKEDTFHGLMKVKDHNENIFFTGRYNEGIIDGFGTYYSIPDGKPILNTLGIYKNDSFQSSITSTKKIYSFYYNTGELYYKGTMKNFLPSGDGRIFYNREGNNYYIGEFNNGYRHGKGKLYNKGTSIEGFWKLDEPDKKMSIYHHDDSTYFEGFFDKTKKKGCLYHANGILKLKGTFKPNLYNYVGKGIEYKENGTFLRKGLFREEGFFDIIQQTIKNFFETRNEDLLKDITKEDINIYLSQKNKKYIPLYKKKSEFISKLLSIQKEEQKQTSTKNPILQTPCDLFGNEIITPCTGSDSEIYDLVSMEYLFQKDENDNFIHIPYIYNKENIRIPNFPRMANGKQLSSFSINTTF